MRPWCPKPKITPPDAYPEYDIDGDGISNAVELNDANSYLGLDDQSWNANPSIAHGTPNDGWIEHALNLPDQGAGYWHNRGTDPVDKDDWGVLSMLNMLEGAGRDWLFYREPPPVITINDISEGDETTQVFGGYWSDHPGGSHQNGLDVDIRYIRKDNELQGLSLKTQAGRDAYDAPATARMLTDLIRNGSIIKIILSPHHSLRFPPDTSRAYVVVTDTSHDDHIHLRIEDPDGTNN
ncbi:MAG: hypothetical protein J7J98_03985 [candidate division Zixibacteria bacterium]|nr:hypothetical protein [candidate division Zixibacteria bacterium]